MGKKYHIIFDLDGTILDTEFDVSRNTAKIAAERGCIVSVEDVFHHCAGLTGMDKYRTIAQLVGMTLTEDDLAYFARRHLEEKGKMFETAPTINPGMLEVLQALTDAGHLLSIGSSNMSAHSTLGLTAARLHDFFAERIYGCDHADDRKKPDPGIFLHAMMANGVAPEDTIVVEDSLPGIIAARAAGAYVIAYLDPRYTGDIADAKKEAYKKAGANVIIRSYADFMKAMPVSTTPVHKRSPKI